ncbi:MAG: hypothetical protein O3A92_08790 [Verrucomicrobia bacterium]|nr:hypothetical protein [Verrucomicrobiota bacterium]
MSEGPVATVKAGAVRIPIYFIQSRETYMAKWTEGGRDRRKKGRDLAKLKIDVRKTAKAIDAGTIDFATLSPAQKAACEEVIRRGLTVDQLNGLRSLKPTSTQSAVAEYLASKADASGSHIKTLKTHLNQFCLQFGKRPLSSIQTGEIDKWLMVSAAKLRTRKNKRGSIVALWRWARDKDYLAQDTRTAAERSDAPSSRQQKRDRNIETWSPDELQKILATCPKEYLPWVVLSSFAGLRTLELFRDEKDPKRQKDVLQWEHVHLDGKEPRILVPAAVAKTADQRSIPICPTLRQWLKRIAKKSGPVVDEPCPWRKLKRWNGKSANDFIAEAAGVDFKKNAFRHAFGTYRVIQAGAVGPVALEMGNSESMVKMNYLDAGRTKAEAKAWFALTPSKIKK